MSLLMEALRKAEEAKRLAQDGSDSEAPDSRPAGAYPHRKKKPLSQQSSFESDDEFPPLSAADTNDQFETIAFDASPRDEFAATAIAETTVPPAATALPHRSSQPEPDHDAPPTARPRVKVEPPPAKQAAAAMFAAKRNPAPTNRTALVVLATLALFLLPLSAGLYWYLMQGSSSLVMTSNFTPPPPGAFDTPTPATPPAALETATTTTAELAAPDTNTPLAAPALAATEPTPTDSAEAPAQPAVATAAPPAPESSEPQTATVPAQLAAAPAPPGAQDDALALPPEPPASSLRISRATGAAHLHPQLTNAYASLQRGDYANARLLYQEVLGDEPENRDALLGLATTQARLGQAVEARRLYSRLLQLNPRDPLAHAGLLQELSVGAVPDQENELKALISQFPGVAQLPFAQGNFYAAQGRWSEAQAAYFNALLLARRDGAIPSPDYAFNLAVSLEQLGQAASALDYYRQAQQYASLSPPGFDPAVLQERLRFLGQQLP